MSRPPRYSKTQLLDAAILLASQGGAATLTMSGVAAAVGAPSGSVYHRFGGRAELQGEVWLAATECFSDWWWVRAERCVDAGDAAVLPVQWARTHPDLARILLLHRASDFLASGAADALQLRAAHNEARSRERLLHLTQRFLGDANPSHLDRATFALATLPVGAVRGPLSAQRPISESLESLVREAASALLEAK